MTDGGRRERLPARAPAAARPSHARCGRAAAFWPRAIVAAAVGWNLVTTRALTDAVAYLNDSSMHEQMVRFATAQLRAGRFPLSSWFPYLGEGSPQFLHYQSLPAILTGVVGLLTGPDTAFRWSLYLLLSLWPISVYHAARAFGARRPAAAASAAMSPFLSSTTGIGYELHAYVWTGFGVWTQLWAMWTLPLAWGWSWRAIRDGRGYLRAVLLTALTAALHFETGYLALSVLLFWPLAAGRPFVVHLRRAGMLLGGSLLAASWVIVPLLAERNWAAINEPLQGTPFVNGYGAHLVTYWLVSGQLLDAGRLPVITVLAAVGLGVAWLSWPSNHDGRAVLVALGASLLLAFGRTTFGPAVDAIPGSGDIFFRRFMMGAQLAALLLAGGGAELLATACARLLEARVRHWSHSLTVAAALVAAVAVLAPAWLEAGAESRHDSAAIAAQRHADATSGAELDRILARITRSGGGRTYAGMPTNWGEDFTVGAVPVFKYLESRDVDEVGYTLRTASLMTDPEYYFDERNPSDYRIFGIRYLVLPVGRAPMVRAHLVMRSGPYTLWTVDGVGYIEAGRIVGDISESRRNVGTRSIALLHSDLAGDGEYLAVRWGRDGTAPSRRGVARDRPGTATGTATVSAEHSDLHTGTFSATVHLSRRGVAVLSASYDPGWTALVDGRHAATRMVAPALVGIDVPAGTDHVVFRYRGAGDYPELFLLSGADVVGFAVLDTRRRDRHHDRRPSAARRLRARSSAGTARRARSAPEGPRSFSSRGVA